MIDLLGTLVRGRPNEKVGFVGGEEVDWYFDRHTDNVRAEEHRKDEGVVIDSGYRLDPLIAPGRCSRTRVLWLAGDKVRLVIESKGNGNVLSNLVWLRDLASVSGERFNDRKMPLLTIVHMFGWHPPMTVIARGVRFAGKGDGAVDVDMDPILVGRQPQAARVGQLTAHTQNENKRLNLGSLLVTQPRPHNVGLCVVKRKVLLADVRFATTSLYRQGALSGLRSSRLSFRTGKTNKSVIAPSCR